MTTKNLSDQIKVSDALLTVPEKIEKNEIGDGKVVGVWVYNTLSGESLTIGFKIGSKYFRKIVPSNPDESVPVLRITTEKAAA